MQPNIKLTQIMGSLTLFICGLFLILITLLISLLPSGIAEGSIIIGISIVLFNIVFVEGSLYWVVKSFAIKEENMQDLRKKGILSQGASAIALFFRYKSIFLSIISILIFVGLIAGTIYYFVPLLIKGITFSIQFYVIIGIYLFYFLVLRRFITKFLSKTGKKFAKGRTPDFSIEKDGIIFNLPFQQGKIGMLALIGFVAGSVAVVFGIIGLKIPMYRSIGVFVILFFIAFFGSKKNIVSYPVKIKFSEIQEVKSLSFVEAESLLRYEIGPDITLQAQSIRDMFIFLKDPTNPKNRPNTYTLVTHYTGARTLLLRGPNLFYIIAVNNEDADELARKIQKHIKK